MIQGSNETGPLADGPKGVRFLQLNYSKAIVICTARARLPFEDADNLANGQRARLRARGDRDSNHRPHSSLNQQVHRQEVLLSLHDNTQCTSDDLPSTKTRTISPSLRLRIQNKNTASKH